MADQIIGTALLAVFAFDEVSPDIASMVVSAIAPLVIGAVLITRRRWPTSVLEPITWGAGLTTAWMGIVSSLKVAERPTARGAILAVYLIATALLLIAAPDYMTTGGLGTAGCLLDIVAFSAWAAAWLAPWRQYVP